MNLKYHESLVKIWNPTIANLSLVVFTNSAPQILFMLIETIQALGSNDINSSEMGISLIVGSAAFNTIFVTGFSIWATTRDKD